MKFILLVEGHAETKSVPAFLKRWLDPKLSQPVGIRAVKSDGWRELKKDAPIKAKLRGVERDVIAVIGLMDLYGPDYPPHVRTASERYEWLVGEIEKDVSFPKYRQFAAVHELEAWLLSDERIFDPRVGQALTGKAQRPEEVDFDEPPKKLLVRLYKERLRRKYRSTVDTTLLFEKLNPDQAYQRCPHLRLLMDAMLDLARAAGL